MSESNSTLSQLVRRAAPNATPASDEVGVHLRDGKVVHPGRPRPFFSLPEAPPELWIVRTPREPLAVLLREEEITLPGGVTARVDLHCERVRVITGMEERLVLAVHRAPSVGLEIERRLSAILATAAATLKGATPTAWRTARTALIGALRQRIREELGLTAELRVLPSSRRGRRTYGPLSWSLPAPGSADPLPFEVTVTLVDNEDYLPPLEADEEEELRRLRDALARATGSVKLADYHRRPIETNSTLKALALGDLAALGRGIEELTVRPATPEPAAQVRIERAVGVRAGQRDLQFQLDALLTRGNLFHARDFSLTSQTALGDALVAELERIAERRLAAVRRDELHLGSPDPVEAVRNELAAWVEAETGYSAHHLSLRLSTAAPTPPQVVRLAKRVDLAIAGQPALGVDLKATLRLRDTRAWLRADAPDVQVRWEDALSGALLAALHAVGEGEAPAARAGLAELLTTTLGKDAAEVGFALDGQVLLDVAVPPGAQTRAVTLKETVALPAAETDLPIHATAELRLVDPWRYHLSGAARSEDWARALLRDVLRDELAFVELDELRASVKRLQGAITERYRREVAARGYELSRLQCRGLDELLRAPRLVVPLAVPLQVTVSGTPPVQVELKATLRLRDEDAWRREGAPDVEARWKVALHAVARGELHGLDPSDAARVGPGLAERLGSPLRRTAEEVGYELVSVKVEIPLPPEQREIQAGTTRGFPLAGLPEPLVIGVTATLRVTDPWAWQLAAPQRPEGWADALVAEVVAQELAHLDLDAVRSDTDGARARIDAALARAFRERGYETVRTRIDGLRALEPKLERVVALTCPLEIALPGAPTLALEARATLRLQQEARWRETGKPDVHHRAAQALAQAARGSLHTVADAQAPSALAALRESLRVELERAVGDLGYGVEGVRVEPLVPRGERERQVDLDGEFTLLGGSTVQIRGSAHARIGDGWRFQLAADARPLGWDREELRATVAEELGFVDRTALRLRRHEVEDAVARRYAERLGARGFVLERLQLRGLELPEPKRDLRQTLRLGVPLPDPRDHVRWAGTVEARLTSSSTWAEALEPDVGAELPALAERALSATLREVDHGDLDERPDHVQQVFREHLDRALGELGYGLAGAVGRLEADNAPPASEEVETSFKCIVEQRKVEVRATVRVRRTSASAWRASGERDLRKWLGDTTCDVVRDALLPLSYLAVLEDVTAGHMGNEVRIAAEVQQELSRRLAPLGYEVQQVLAFPDREARELLGGFKIERQRAFPTAWAGREVVLDIWITGRFAELSAPTVRGLLAREEPVLDWLYAQVERRLQARIIEKTPNDVYLHWQAAQGGLRDELIEEVRAVLASHAVADEGVQLTPQPPPYFKALEELRGGGPYPIEVLLPERHHRGAHLYRGSFLVTGLDDKGSDNLFNRTTALDDRVISATLAGFLAQALAHREEQTVLLEDSAGGDWPDKVVELARLARGFCGANFGLIVELLGLTRVSKDTERLKFLYEETLAHGQVVALEHYRRQLEQYGGQALGSGPLTLPELPYAAPGSPLLLGTQPVFQAPERSLAIATPTDGHPSAEDGCPLKLSATVRLRAAAAPPESVTLELREALRAVLAATDPARFWLAFPQGTPEDPSVEARVRDALKAAAVRLGHPEPIVEIEPPPREHLERLHALMNRDIVTRAARMEIDDGKDEAHVSAAFTVTGVVPGRWRRFDASKPTPDAVAGWAEKWMGKLGGLGFDLATATVQEVQPAFARDLGAEFGLVGELLRFDVAKDARERAALRDELRAIEKTIRELEARPEDISIRRSIAVKQQRRKDIEAALAVPSARTATVAADGDRGFAKESERLRADERGPSKEHEHLRAEEAGNEP